MQATGEDSMSTTTRAGGFALTAGIVELTLTTAAVHASLGGLLFTLNAAGYVALATAIIAAATIRHPLVRRFSWLRRIALAGYTGVTIGAYLVMGPYFALGWVAKAIEVAIVTLVAADLIRVHGGPTGLWRAMGDAFRRRRPAESLPARG
jgi:hypothetical protein